MYNDNLKDQVKKISPAELEARGVIAPARKAGTYICPICGNGTGDTGDGLVVYDNFDGYQYHCYKNGCHFDNIALLGLHYNLDPRNDFREILNRAAEEFFGGNFEVYHGVVPMKIEKFQPAPPKIEGEVDRAELRALIHNDIIDAQKHLVELPKTFPYCRGVSLGTLEYFGVGYIKSWLHPNWRLKNYAGKIPRPTERVIIPAFDSYEALLPKDIKFRTAGNKRWWKMNAGGKNPFGTKTITADTEVILVFEDAFSAMSAFDCDFLRKTLAIFGTADYEVIEGSAAPNKAYIATNGAAMEKWMKIVAQICHNLNIAPAFAVCLDEDKAGYDNADKQVALIEGYGYSATTFFRKKA